MLQGEDNVSTIVRPTLEAMGAELDRILVIADKSPISLPRDVALVRSAVQDIGAKLVVVDPMDEFIDANLRDNRQARKALFGLVSLAEEDDFSLIVVRHPTKGTSKALDSGSGSKGIIGLARSALFVGHDPGSDDSNQNILALSKSNLATASAVTYRTVQNANGVIVVEWLGPSSLSADEVIRFSAAAQDPSELDRAKDFLFCILREGPRPSRQVMAMARGQDLSERTVRRAAKDLRIRPKKKGTICWVWRLPDDREFLAPSMDRYLDGLHDYLLDEDDDRGEMPLGGRVC